ncbi:MAG: DUF5686 family protein [Emticicia sp.]|nr:DUF5686 family protein [Emticicia sp.]
MIRKLIILFILGLNHWGMAQIAISGKVVDVSTKEPLPFLSVISEKSKNGTQTNEKGEFTIKVASLGEMLSFSFMGYKKANFPAEKNMLVGMEADLLMLGEVVVRYRNPAERIIKKATENKVFNNPDNFSNYAYKSYNKSILTADSDSKGGDIGNKKGRKLAKRLENSELYVNETVVRKKYLFGGQSKEIVEASRTSGSENSTILGSMALMLQPFSFYPDLITFKGRRIQEIMEFVNPVSQNSNKIYDFTLLDTLINGADSSFVIAFLPKKGANIKGLKGEIIISSDGYAIEEVSAEPADKNMLMSVSIYQEYHKIAGRWFPKVLKSDWRMPQFKVGEQKLLFRIESYIEEVSFDNKFQNSDFSENAISIAADATTKKEDFWMDNRSENLSSKESNTYEYYQNLSGLRKFLSMASLNVSEWATSGVIPLSSKIDLSTQNLFDSNIYEGFRPTINLLTSPNFSKRIRLDAKLAYGFSDKAWKYEGRIKYNLGERKNSQVVLQYRNDISEPGNVQYFIWNYPQIPYELIRTFLISRADHLEQYKLEWTSKISKFGKLTLGFTDEVRTPTYAYKFMKNDSPIYENNSFHASIFTFGYRLAIGEKFSQVGRGSIISEVPKVVLLLNYDQGVMGFLSGAYQFSKLNAKMEYTHKSTRFGDTFINFSAGKAFGDLPYSYLYNSRGSKISNTFPIVWAANHFNTMGLYEFVSDQYSTIFITHRFKELLMKTNVSWSKPDVSFTQGFTIGSLKNAQQHKGIEIKTLEKGYFESGLAIDNIVRIKLKKLFYLGIGGGVFYRWGAYSLPQQNQNLTYRLVWNIGF